MDTAREDYCLEDPDKAIVWKIVDNVVRLLPHGYHEHGRYEEGSE